MRLGAGRGHISEGPVWLPEPPGLRLRRHGGGGVGARPRCGGSKSSADPLTVESSVKTAPGPHGPSLPGSGSPGLLAAPQSSPQHISACKQVPAEGDSPGPPEGKRSRRAHQPDGTSASPTHLHPWFLTQGPAFSIGYKSQLPHLLSELGASDNFPIPQCLEKNFLMGLER